MASRVFVKRQVLAREGSNPQNSGPAFPWHCGEQMYLVLHSALDRSPLQTSCFTDFTASRLVEKTTAGLDWRKRAFGQQEKNNRSSSV